MATERDVSHYNNIKTAGKASFKPETINSVMQVSLNGKATSVFDPRPAVYEFLKRKDRRNRAPNEVRIGILSKMDAFKGMHGSDDEVIVISSSPDKEDIKIIFSVPNTKSDNVDDETESQMYSILPDFEDDEFVRQQSNSSSVGSISATLNMGIFNEIECKHVKELPFDIDGFCHFQLECDPSNIMKSSKDGRRWKTWCTSKRKEYRGVKRRARCGGSWKCPNEDCLFLRKKGSPNDVQFTNNEIGKKCFICEEEAIFVECKAIKAESLADSRRVQDTKAKATKSLESHGYSFDAFCEFKKFCDERHPNLLYRFNDERQNDNNTFVFKCSRFQANLAMSMDCEKIGLLHDQYCYADATHKRCPGFKTITLWVYHPLLRKLVEWKGTMESTTEDTEAMDVSGDKTYVFNPAGWVLDEAGAEWNAIKIVFGEDAMAKVVSCEFHYKQSVGRKSGKLDNKHKAEFKALAWALMEANTVSVFGEKTSGFESLY
ncbi:Hypothetical predicted protein [Paramuricea clavata]|uniref:Uncharacterized protein n=1 Tax=Paramuricea clavata TaxID=317549 RepID=A0A6S7LM72_PARCT|nr:Hypothetical predicted protein [Paramuricea clavata]